MDEIFDDETIDEIDDFEQPVESPEQEPDTGNDGFLQSYLREKGIDDLNKIKFENEDGEIEERSWDTLSNEDKLNILKSSNEDPDTDLEDDEIELINSIRRSGLSTKEYLDTYLNQRTDTQSIQEPQYEIDQYSDEELYVLDLVSKIGDISQEEVEDALEKAKSNPTLFKKQVDALRSEYKRIEDENKLQEQQYTENVYKERFQEFSNKIVDEINSFTEFQGLDIDMENDDKQMLYDFITGHDSAGNNYFTKALQDPQTLVKTAWLALNGEQMIQDITKYFQKEITNVRRESYNKGLADARNGRSNVIYKEKNMNLDHNTDLDDF